jgi:hypothetical protein
MTSEVIASDLDCTGDAARAIGEGRRPCALPLGQQTRPEPGRYLRARANERQANRPELWLAEENRGAVSPTAGRMLRRRGTVVGIPGSTVSLLELTSCTANAISSSTGLRLPEGVAAIPDGHGPTEH